MNLSASSLTTAMTCWQKTLNVYHRQLRSENYNLIDGGATHAGIAHGLATKNWDEALVVAKASFATKIEDYAWKADLDPELVAHEQLVVEMVKAFAEGFRGENYQIIQPECTFVVDLPNSHHNNIFKHWKLVEDGKPEVVCWSKHEPQALIDHLPDAMGGPNVEDILACRVRSPHPTPDPACLCWEPHRVVGTTDAIVLWNKCLWLLEHKTSAISGEQFWAGFRLDVQPTIYLYGVSKSLNMTINGFIVNQIRKPSMSQVQGWNNRRKHGPAKEQKDYISYAREAFLRTPEDLQRVEVELIRWADEWERKVVNGWFPMSNYRTICMQYNRPCQFFELCLHGGEDNALVDALKASLVSVGEAKRIVEEI